MRCTHAVSTNRCSQQMFDALFAQKRKVQNTLLLTEPLAETSVLGAGLCPILSSIRCYNCDPRSLCTVLYLPPGMSAYEYVGLQVLAPALPTACIPLMGNASGDDLELVVQLDCIVPKSARPVRSIVESIAGHGSAPNGRAIVTGANGTILTKIDESSSWMLPTASRLVVEQIPEIPEVHTTHLRMRKISAVLSCTGSLKKASTCNGKHRRSVPELEIGLSCHVPDMNLQMCTHLR